MSKENAVENNDEQDFEDAFDEFAGADTSSINDEQEEESSAHEDDQSSAPEKQEEPKQQQDEISELERYKAEAQQWQHRYNSDMGRQAALQRKIQELESQLQKAPAENPKGSGMSNAEWDSLKEDFPEIAAAVESKLTGLTSQYEQRITQLQGQMAPIQQQAHKTYIESQYHLLEQQHPDYQEIAGSAAFNEWAQQQPDAIKQLLGSEQAADAAYLLTTYKLHTGSAYKRSDDAARQRDRKLNQARTIPGRSGSTKPVIAEDDFDAAFDYYAKQG